MGIFSRKKVANKELELLLDGYELPSFPVIVLKVLSMLRDRSCDMSTVSGELALDPSLVVSVLKWLTPQLLA